MAQCASILRHGHCINLCACVFPTYIQFYNKLHHMCTLLLQITYPFPNTGMGYPGLLKITYVVRHSYKNKQQHPVNALLLPPMQAGTLLCLF